MISRCIICGTFRHGGLGMKFKDKKGCPISGTNKQELNTNNSMIKELVAVHQYLPKVLWTPLFVRSGLQCS